MNISQCIRTIVLGHLPHADLEEWSDDQRDYLCAAHYSFQEYKPYDFSPFTQGALLIQSLGQSIDDLPKIREDYYRDYKDTLSALVKIANVVIKGGSVDLPDQELNDGRKVHHVAMVGERIWGDIQDPSGVPIFCVWDTEGMYKEDKNHRMTMKGLVI